YDHLRKRKRDCEFRPDENTWALIANHTSDGSVTELENREIALVIELLTSELSPKQKAVFIMSEIEEMSSDEIAGITGMNKSSVKSNLHYARKNIEIMIKKYI
ncbi:MAG: RNA polymerase sigma factor, partial [Bacteroidales bacterium]